MNPATSCLDPCHWTSFLPGPGKRVLNRSSIGAFLRAIPLDLLSAQYSRLCQIGGRGLLPWLPTPTPYSNYTMERRKNEVARLGIFLIDLPISVQYYGIAT